MIRREEVKEVIPRPGSHQPRGADHFDEKEKVVVERTVHVTENKFAELCDREVDAFVPKWKKHTRTYKVPRATTVQVPVPVDITSKRIVDEYVEEYVEAGVIKKQVPVFNVEERTVQVKRPRIKYITEVQPVPVVQELVRYVDADEHDDSEEIITRYVPEDAEFDIDQIAQGAQADPHMEDRADEAAADDEAVEHLFEHLDHPVTIDVPVPFVVPKPLAVDIDVPVVKFNDTFVPVPVRRKVQPRLTFTTEVYKVRCNREKVFVTFEDVIQPVPVNVHLKVTEKDVKVNPIDLREISQADMHALWMRTAADQLEVYRKVHGDKLPHEMRVPEELKTPEKPTDWSAVLRSEEAEAGCDTCESDDFIPIDGNHPLMTTWLQSQWMNTPTTQLQDLYSPEFFKMHYASLCNIKCPTYSAVALTPEQIEKYGPNHEQQLPHPWGSISSLRSQQAKDLLSTDEVEAQLRSQAKVAA